MIAGHLAHAGGPTVGCHPHKGKIFGRKTLNFGDFHLRSYSCLITYPVRFASHEHAGGNAPCMSPPRMIHDPQKHSTASSLRSIEKALQLLDV
jgi:hypothetical protein